MDVFTFKDEFLDRMLYGANIDGGKAVMAPFECRNEDSEDIVISSRGWIEPYGLFPLSDPLYQGIALVENDEWVLTWRTPAPGEPLWHLRYGRDPSLWKVEEVLAEDAIIRGIFSDMIDAINADPPFRRAVILDLICKNRKDTIKELNGAIRAMKEKMDALQADLDEERKMLREARREAARQISQADGPDATIIETPAPS